MRERLIEIIRKEFRQAFREPRMRTMLFLPPVIQLLIFGYAVNLDVEHASMAWMDQDRTPKSRELLAGFQGSGRFQIVARKLGIFDAFEKFAARIVVEKSLGVVARQFVDDVAASGEIADQHALVISNQFRPDVFVGFRILKDSADVDAAFVCEGALAHERGAARDRKVGQFRDVASG